MNVIKKIGFRNLMQLSLNNTRPLIINNLLNFSSNVANKEDVKKSRTSHGQQYKDPKKLSPKITLINTDESIDIVNLDEAQHISKRRNLKLIQVLDIDVKTQRPVYKLMTPHDYLTEELKKREEKKKSKENQTIKGEKLLSVGYKITDHDLQIKINMAQKWLRKSFEVRVVIQGHQEESKKKQEKIALEIETATADLGKPVQRRMKEHDLRFQIIPLKKEAVNETEAAETETRAE